ncbi:MAG: helix-turn-helix domain-containing protein [Burkholderiaceae bacterium]
MSDRHLRRIFESALGISPLQYLQTRRLLTAKQLLTDTAMPSPRWRWPAALAACAASTPHLRSTMASTPCGCAARARCPARGIEAVSAWPTARPSMRRRCWPFFAQRQFEGGGWARADDALTLRRTVRLPVGAQSDTGWLAARFDTQRHLVLLDASSLHPVLPQSDCPGARPAWIWMPARPSMPRCTAGSHRRRPARTRHL